MNQRFSFFLKLSVLCAIGLFSFENSTEAADTKPVKTIRFNRDIRPILSDNCFHCHGPAEKSREAELRLDVEESAFANRDGSTAVVPGDLKNSQLWERVSTTDADLIMPPHDSNKKLTAKQIETLKLWIEQGANWEGHWAFVTPEVPAVPEVKQQDKVRNPIDAFIFSRLQQEGLSPSPEASRETLIRRLSFDLTGLPPSPKQIDAFLNDKSPGAYEKLVDRLLVSKHYGERMTLAWLDASRYGDTSVFHADGPRDMWPWRNWVINAYNSNMPFSQFTIEQLGGDLIESATVDQQTASGFHRNHGTTDEGGAIAEEYRVEYVVDRVKTTGTVWLGLTMECAQCHQHKFDPISQKEYYQFYAFFNQSTDAGMQTRKGNAQPLIDIPNLEGEKQAVELEKQVVALNTKIENRSSAVTSEFQAWLKEATEKNAGKAQTPGNMLAHFLLDEKKGKQISDAIDAKRKGTVKGKANWVDGKLSGGLRFDGATFVDCGDIADFERTDKFSYGGWVYFDKNTSGAPIARMDDKNGFRGYDLYIAGDKVAVHIINSYPSNALKVTTKTPIKKEQWHHVFATYDGSSKAAGIKIYVDGKQQEWNIEQNSLKSTIRTKKTLYLGSRNPGSRFRGVLDDMRIYDRQLTAVEVATLAGTDPITPILATSADKRTKEQVATLRSHYLTSFDIPYQQLNKLRSNLKSKIAELTKPLSTVMIMKEMAQPRMTYILERGHYGSPRNEEEIKPGTPAALPPMPAGAAKNRLGLAQWLTDPKHPLTARVAVNRYWAMIFGTGIVKTVEDFGSQGDWPSHPELLDWLATDFANNGWNVKRTLKQIVMSATYRQSSRITPELYEADPNNRLLARGPRFRLQGDFIRDQALAVAGLLVPTIGGPGVKPYQPPGLWNEVSLNGGLRFKQDSGEKLYRRSMYTYWKRSAPPPSMMLFDAPSREKCLIQRSRTNTPLQALLTLNDTQFVEAARMMAERVMKEGGNSPESRIRYGYRLVTAHDPQSSVVQILLDTYQTELATFQKDEKRTTELLTVGEFPRDEKLNAAETAGWTVVSSMLLNLDETLTKN